MSHADYVSLPIPRMRQLETDIGWLARQNDAIIGLLEIDVTVPRALIRHYYQQTGERVSFTAFLVACVARAVDEHKEVHAIKDWRGRVTIFDEVDVTTMVEIEANGRRTPVGRIIRAANRKNLRQIHDEIRSTQRTNESGNEARFVQQLTAIPRFVRRPLFWWAIHLPQQAKRLRGTVVVTAVGMFGVGGGWGVALPSHSLVVLVGGIAEKPGVVNGQIAIREYLHVTASFDHAVVDGAPAARFAARLRVLIESGYGLETLAVEASKMGVN